MLERYKQTDSLGNEALRLHSMDDILAKVSTCNQSTKPKTPIQSRIEKNKPKTKLQNPAFPIGFESLQLLGLRRVNHLDVG
ncbi:hypothetical protein HC752_23835 [Vibrio sp. S9_S30]|uniref:hypothetical protein n=1 Tax=Vibrio sp. S9_S30 TaxID=2720226 RepID=UPI001680AF2A|nr:hypothetical protein [Vibrio sp. S9_S30]MBD1559956.1 hypothetical protein [Vibrio sp. S9_S30]